MKRRNFLTGLAGFGVASLAAHRALAQEAWDYHIDWWRGSDEADGLTPQTAFKTPAALTNLRKLRGKRIGIAAGSTFDGDLCDPRLRREEDGIEIGIYGGDLWAAFDCTAAARGWQPSQLSPTVWQCEISFSSEDNKHSGNVFLQGETMPLVATPLELVKAGPGHACVEQWFTFQPTETAILYVCSPVQPRDGEYRYSKHGIGIELLGDDVRVSDVWTQGSLHQDGGIACRGTRATWDRIWALDGSRHNSLIGPDFSIKSSRFFGGRNDAEIAANHVVCFAESFEGVKGGLVEDCLFDAGGKKNNLAFFAHDSLLKHRLPRMDFVRCSFSGQSEGVSASALETNLQDCQSIQGMLVNDGSKGTINIRNSRGSVNTIARLDNDDVEIVLNTSDCDLKIETGSGGSSGFGVHATGKGSRVSWNSTNDKFLGINARALCQIENGEIHRRGATVDGSWDRIDVLGSAENPSIFDGAANSYPYLSAWELNGLRYESVVEWKRAGYDV